MTQDYHQQNSAFDQEVLALRQSGKARVFGYQDDIKEALAGYERHSTWQFIAASRPSWADTRVLDLGAGRGLASRLLAAKGARVVAVDMNISDVAGLGSLRRVSGKIHPVLGLFEALPLAGNSLDAIVCRWVLHHARTLPPVLEECRRVLKPGGLMLAQAEPLLPVTWSKARFLKHHCEHYFSDNVFENADRPWGYASALKTAGFHVKHLGIVPSPAPASLRGKWHHLSDSLPIRGWQKAVLQDPRLLFEPLDITLVAEKTV